MSFTKNVLKNPIFKLTIASTVLFAEMALKSAHESLLSYEEYPYAACKRMGLDTKSYTAKALWPFLTLLAHVGPAIFTLIYSVLMIASGAVLSFLMLGGQLLSLVSKERFGHFMLLNNFIIKKTSELIELIRHPQPKNVAHQNQDDPNKATLRDHRLIRGGLMLLNSLKKGSFLDKLSQLPDNSPVYDYIDSTLGLREEALDEEQINNGINQLLIAFVESLERDTSYPIDADGFVELMAYIAELSNMSEQQRVDIRQSAQNFIMSDYWHKEETFSRVLGALKSSLDSHQNIKENILRFILNPKSLSCGDLISLIEDMLPHQNQTHDWKKMIDFVMIFKSAFPPHLQPLLDKLQKLNQKEGAVFYQTLQQTLQNIFTLAKTKPLASQSIENLLQYFSQEPVVMVDLVSPLLSSEASADMLINLATMFNILTPEEAQKEALDAYIRSLLPVDFEEAQKDSIVSILTGCIDSAAEQKELAKIAITSLLKGSVHIPLPNDDSFNLLAALFAPAQYDEAEPSLFKKLATLPLSQSADVLLASLPREADSANWTFLDRLLAQIAPFVPDEHLKTLLNKFSTLSSEQKVSFHTFILSAIKLAKNEPLAGQSLGDLLSLQQSSLSKKIEFGFLVVRSQDAEILWPNLSTFLGALLASEQEQNAFVNYLQSLIPEGLSEAQKDSLSKIIQQLGRSLSKPDQDLGENFKNLLQILDRFVSKDMPLSVFLEKAESVDRDSAQNLVALEQELGQLVYQALDRNIEDPNLQKVLDKLWEKTLSLDEILEQNGTSAPTSACRTLLNYFSTQHPDYDENYLAWFKREKKSLYTKNHENADLLGAFERFIYENTLSSISLERLPSIVDIILKALNPDAENQHAQKLAEELKTLQGFVQEILTFNTENDEEITPSFSIHPLNYKSEKMSAQDYAEHRNKALFDSARGLKTFLASLSTPAFLDLNCKNGNLESKTTGFPVFLNGLLTMIALDYQKALKDKDAPKKKAIEESVELLSHALLPIIVPTFKDADSNNRARILKSSLLSILKNYQGELLNCVKAVENIHLVKWLRQEARQETAALEAQQSQGPRRLKSISFISFILESLYSYNLNGDSPEFIDILLNKAICDNTISDEDFQGALLCLEQKNILGLLDYLLVNQQDGTIDETKLGLITNIFSDKPAESSVFLSKILLAVFYSHEFIPNLNEKHQILSEGFKNLFLQGPAAKEFFRLLGVLSHKNSSSTRKLDAIFQLLTNHESFFFSKNERTGKYLLSPLLRSLIKDSPFIKTIVLEILNDPESSLPVEVRNNLKQQLEYFLNARSVESEIELVNSIMGLKDLYSLGTKPVETIMNAISDSSTVKHTLQTAVVITSAILDPSDAVHCLQTLKSTRVGIIAGLCFGVGGAYAQTGLRHVTKGAQIWFNSYLAEISPFANTMPVSHSMTDLEAELNKNPVVLMSQGREASTQENLVQRAFR